MSVPTDVELAVNAADDGSASVRPIRAARRRQERQEQRATAPGPDAAQITRFARGVFKYATAGGVVSLRAFHDNATNKVFDIVPVVLNGDLTTLDEAAIALANRAARAAEPVVFCPPLATFTTADSASEDALCEGLALTVELDACPSRARTTLTALLGPPTFTVASGGLWTDPETGETEPKLHAHWRLREPTTTAPEHQHLKRARSLACDLVGADATSKSVVHPIRWPGSVHRKSAPRLAHIIEETSNEIDINTTLDVLEMHTPNGGGGPQQHTDAKTEYSYDTVLDVAGLMGCAERIQNADDEWAKWNTIGMASWRASAGSEDGFAAFDLYSRKSEKYDAKATRVRWTHYARSKPTKAGAQTLIYWARKTDPTFQPREFVKDGREPEDGGDDSDMPPPPAEETEPRASYRVFSLADAARLPPVAWRVNGILPERGKFCLAGPPGSGKGLVAIDLMLSIATGLPLRGEIAVVQGPVLYLAAEGWPGIPQRCAAWLAANDFDAATGGPNGTPIPFYILPAAPQLNSTGDLSRVLATIDSMPVRPVVAVIDTLSRTLSGSDSEAKDMNPYLHAIDRLQHAIDGLVGVLHHTGWNTNRERGFSGLRGDVDTMVLLARDELHITVTCEKQKDAEEFSPLTYAICSDGHSVYAAPVRGPEAPTEPTELTGSRRKAFDALLVHGKRDGLGFENWIGTSGLPRNTLNEARKDLVRWGFVESKKRKWCVVARFFDE